MLENEERDAEWIGATKPYAVKKTRSSFFR